jgi:hypothetical protein
MRTLFVCRGRPGLGHIMPAIAVDSALRDIVGSTYKSWFATYGNPVSAIKDVDLIEVQYPYAGVGYSGLPVIRGLWPNLGNLIDDLNPDVIVGSGEFLLPIYGMVTDRKIVSLANLRYLRIEQGYFGKLNPLLSWLHRNTSLVLDYSLDGGEVDKIGPNTQWTGPLVRRMEHEDVSSLRTKLGLPLNRGIVLVTKGGGEDFPADGVKGKGARSEQEKLNLKLLCTAFEVASMNSANEDLFFIVITGLGDLYPEVTERISELKLTNIRCEGFVSNILEYYAAADVVIGRAGVSMIGEAIYYRCPQILVPIHTDSEQVANAEFLADRDAAICIPTDRLSPELLDRAVQELITDVGKTDSAMARRARDLFPNIDAGPFIAAQAINALRGLT